VEELTGSASAKAETLTPRDPRRIFTERVEKAKREGGGGGFNLYLRQKFKMKMLKFPPSQFRVFSFPSSEKALSNFGSTKGLLGKAKIKGKLKGRKIIWKPNITSRDTCSDLSKQELHLVMFGLIWLSVRTS
jgi:hypothetical protein